jgi:hypothetical protein
MTFVRVQFTRSLAKHWQRVCRPALLMLYQDLGPDRHARVKIGDIVVDQPEAT